jgi:hypothetical protein
MYRAERIHDGFAAERSLAGSAAATKIGLSGGFKAAPAPVATGEACVRLRSSRKPGPEVPQMYRAERIHDGFAAERSLAGSAAATKIGLSGGFKAAPAPVATGEACVRLRSSRKPGPEVPQMYRAERIHDGFAAERSLAGSAAAT